MDEIENLERLAKAADKITAETDDGKWYQYEHLIRHSEPADARLIAACTPELILRLCQLVQGQEWEPDWKTTEKRLIDQLAEKKGFDDVRHLYKLAMRYYGSLDRYIEDGYTLQWYNPDGEPVGTDILPEVPFIKSAYPLSELPTKPDAGGE